MEPTGWAAAISGVAAIILLVLKVWLSKEPERKAENRNGEIQNGRRDIAGGNVDAVSQRVDSVLTDSPGNPAGLGSDEDTKRRIGAIIGVDSE